MCRKYQGFPQANHAQLQALGKEFEVLATREGETIDEYFARTLAIANHMTAHGEKMEQVLVVEKIVRSFTSKFNYLVCSVEEYNDVTALSIDELQSCFLVQQERVKSQNQEIDVEKALKISNVGRGYWHGRGRAGSRGCVRGRLKVKKHKKIGA